MLKITVTNPEADFHVRVTPVIHDGGAILPITVGGFDRACRFADQKSRDDGVGHVDVLDGEEPLARYTNGQVVYWGPFKVEPVQAGE